VFSLNLFWKVSICRHVEAAMVVVEMNQKFKCRRLNSFYFGVSMVYMGFLISPEEMIHDEHSLPIGLSLNHQQPEFKQ